jgi:hypothetical protein
MLIRTIVYLDDALLARLQSISPAQDLSQLINDLLYERVVRLEQTRFAAAMREGYLATRQDRQVLNADWQAVDADA